MHEESEIIEKNSNVHPSIYTYIASHTCLKPQLIQWHKPFVKQGEGWSQAPEYVKENCMSYLYDALFSSEDMTIES